VKRSAPGDRCAMSGSRIALRSIQATTTNAGSHVLAFHSCGRTAGSGVKLGANGRMPAGGGMSRPGA
jgi:hypothetical protein